MQESVPLLKDRFGLQPVLGYSRFPIRMPYIGKERLLHMELAFSLQRTFAER
jgi:hypothetical protein